MSTAYAAAASLPPFAEVYTEFLPRITGFLRGKLYDARDAEDVAALVFTRAFQAYTRYEPRTNTPAAWLFKIARNAALDHCRRDQQRQHAERTAGRENDLAPDPVRVADLRLACRELRRAVAQLPQRQRQSVAYRLQDGLSFKEIGSQMGCTDDAAKVLFHRGVKTLRQTAGLAA
jgi:RNA polymerase sigma-70 factor (ECF subfamily)